MISTPSKIHTQTTIKKDTIMSDATATAPLDNEPVEAEIVDEDTLNGGTTGTDVAASVAALRAGGTDMYSTISAVTFSEKLALASKVNDAKRIDENLGAKFILVDYIVNVVSINNQQTGEINVAPRVTLIADDGTAYVGTSIGLLNSIKALESVMGSAANWAPGEGVPVEVVEEGVRPRKYFTLKY